MTSQKLITVVVFALILGLSAIDVDAGALDAAKIGASLNSEAPESSSEIANSTVSEEKDYEEIAKLEGRKDWTLAIEKSRKVLMELEPDDEYRVVELDDEVMENKMHVYKLLFRSENKSCVVTVEQEAEDKFTVQESGDANEKAVCTEED